MRAREEPGFEPALEQMASDAEMISNSGFLTSHFSPAIQKVLVLWKRKSQPLQFKHVVSSVACPLAEQFQNSLRMSSSWRNSAGQPSADHYKRKLWDPEGLSLLWVDPSAWNSFKGVILLISPLKIPSESHFPTCRDVQYISRSKRINLFPTGDGQSKHSNIFPMSEQSRTVQTW